MPRTAPWAIGVVCVAAAGLDAGVTGEVLYYHLGGLTAGPQTAASPVVEAPADRLAVEVLVPHGLKGVVVVPGSTDESGSTGPAYRLVPNERKAMHIALPRQPGARITAGANGGDGVYLGSSCGLIRILGDVARPFEEFVGVQDGAYGTPGPTVVLPYALDMVTDREGNVWVVGDRRRGSYGFDGYGSYVVFSGDESAWEKPAGGERAGGVPRLLRWRAPCQAIAADHARAAVWAYGTQGEGPPVLVHVDLSMASAVPMTEPASAVPEGEATPALAHACLAADAEGRVWLAGDTLDGSKVHEFDGQTFAERTPPPELLRGRRFTQLMAGADGGLYASTDGVGVLVLDDGAWGPHPINGSLPTLEGTELKPVSCMTLDSDGNLWVGMDNNVICWRPDSPQ